MKHREGMKSDGSEHNHRGVGEKSSHKRAMSAKEGGFGEAPRSTAPVDKAPTMEHALGRDHGKIKG